MAGPEIAAAMTIGTSLLKDLFMYLKDKHNYVKELERIFESLEISMEFLCAERIDIEEKIDRYQITNEMTEKCKTWLSRTKKTEEKYEKLQTKYQKVCKSKKEVKKLQIRNQNSSKSEEEVEDLQSRNQNSCKYRFCRCQFFTLAKLAKDIVKETELVKGLIERLKGNDLMTLKKPELFERKHPNKINEFSSLHDHVKDLLELLKDENVKRIGIWGSIGVGKTTILQNLNDELISLNDQNKQFPPSPSHSTFDIIIYVTVGRENSVWKIQQALLEKLDILVPDNSKQQCVQDENRKQQLVGTISRALKERKYLLLLDQVSSVIDLTEVGISDSHQNGKVVMVTRDRTLYRHMGDIQRIIHVKSLSDEDAMNLFKKIVGDVVDHPRLEDIARRLLVELGGLPQVIKSVASHLKEERNESRWNFILDKLRSHTNSAALQELGGVYNFYEMVYNELEDNWKKCMLSGALFPKDYDIYRDYLIECWRAEDFIPEPQARPGTTSQLLRKARDEGTFHREMLVELLFEDEVC